MNPNPHVAQNPSNLQRTTSKDMPASDVSTLNRRSGHWPLLQLSLMKHFPLSDLKLHPLRFKLMFDPRTACCRGNTEPNPTRDCTHSFDVINT